MTITADVAVYGDHISAVFAACAAAERGARVVLFSPYRHYGTPFTEGLGRIDFGAESSKRSLGWLQKELFNRMALELGWKGRVWYTTPALCELVLLDMLKARGVMVIDDREISAVSKTGNTIDNVTLTGGSGDTIAATVWVDADEDGDLLAAAGVPWISGRESEATYGETGAAGYRPGSLEALNTSGITYGLVPDPGLTIGAADDELSTMSYRFTITNQPGNKAGWTLPEGADDSLIELRKRRQGYTSASFIPFGLQNIRRGTMSGKTDVNIDLLPHPDLSTWPSASRADRKAMATTMYQEFYLWMYFLATDPSVHYNARKMMEEWQPCRDEHPVSALKWIPTPLGIPGQPYRRGVRRLSSAAHIMTRADCATNKTKTDTIATGHYSFDIHTVRYYSVTGGIKRDPDWSVVPTGGPYEIPYSCMYDPDFPNLLVPNCCGASNVAYASMRIDLYKAGMGAAAGWAAAECALTSTPVYSISVSALQAALVARGHVIHI